jgi:hypothetical protein
MFVPRAAIATYTSSESQVSQPARWSPPAAMVERVRQLNSGARIQVDPAINGLVIDLVSRAAPAVVDAYNRHLLPYAERWFRAWPVKTGFSKSMLALEFEPAGESFTGRLVNRADYAGMIDKGELARRLFKQGDDAATLMALDIGEGIAR